MKVWHIIIFLTLGVTTACPSSANSGIGYWRTDKGYVALRLDGKKVFGHYGSGNGTIYGEVGPDGSIGAIWTDKASPVRCDTQFGVSYYWGHALFEPYGSNRFHGKWSYCGDSYFPYMPWDGVLVAGATWYEGGENYDRPVARPELDMTHETALDLIRAQHGEVMRLTAIDELSGDVTCDGGIDHAFLLHDRAPTTGVAYYLGIAYRNPPVYEGEESESVHLSPLPFGNKSEFAICEGDATRPLSIEFRDVALSPMADLAAPTCSVALVLSDPNCPGLEMIWNLREGGFVWRRDAPDQ
jgi:hypothetical protein